MAYGKIYRFTFTSQNGSEIEIFILKKDYLGDVYTRPLGRAPILRRENNECIYGTSLELYAECRVDGEFAMLYTSAADEYKVEVYRDNEMLWTGFVCPELYSEPDIAPPYDVRIIATDGLGELKRYEFMMSGYYSIGNYIAWLLSYTRLDLSMQVLSTLKGDDIDVLSVVMTLDQYQGSKCYDVLQKLLASMHAVITQQNGKWVILRETDVRHMASSRGLTVKEDGSYKMLTIGRYGSQIDHDWWPIGMLSHTMEPAYNSLALVSETTYLNPYQNWQIGGQLVEYDDLENSYMFLDASNANPSIGIGIIEQTIQTKHDFDRPMSLSFKAELTLPENLDEDDPGTRNIFFQIKMTTPGGSNWYYNSRYGGAYTWNGNSNSQKYTLSPGKQEIQITFPLSSSFSARTLYFHIFRERDAGDIKISEIAIVAGEQYPSMTLRGNIANNAREDFGEVDILFPTSFIIESTSNPQDTVAAVPLNPSTRDYIAAWSREGVNPEKYSNLIIGDYAESIAFPRLSVTGKLNTPYGQELPLIFERDNAYYILKNYSWDLKNDEIDIMLLSLPNAAVEVQSAVEESSISGTTGGSSAGGSGSTTANTLGLYSAIQELDAAFQEINKWACKFSLDSDGNIYLDGNLVVYGESATRASGDPSTGGGIDKNQLADYLEEYKYINEDALLEYNFADEAYVNSEIAKITPASLGVYTTSEVDAIVNALGIPSLKSKVESIESTLGDDVSGKINTWNEIVNFLDEYNGSEDLATILSKMQGDIDSRALGTDLNETIARVEDNEDAIEDLQDNKADNATVNAIDDRLKAEEDVTKTYSAWWKDLMTYVKVVDGNVVIDTNLLVEGESATRGVGDPSTGGGIDKNQLAAYLEEYKYINEDALLEYGFATEQDVNDAIDALNIGDYAKTSEVERLFTALNIGQYAKTADVNAALGDKVDKVSGKGLSTNDFTTALLNKLNAIAEGAEVNVQSDWNATSGDAFIKNKPTLGALAAKDNVAWSEVQSKPTFADVATSGSYNDLSDKPTIPTTMAWTAITDKPTFALVATSGKYSDLLGAPALAKVAISGKYSDLSGTPSLAAVATSGAYTDLTGRPNLGDLAYENGITKTMITEALDYVPLDAANFTKDNITTKIGTTTYAAYNANGYLPLSGGTINGALTLSKEGSDIFVINRLNSSSPTTITYRKDNSLLGRMGFDASTKEPVAQVSGTYQTLLHSGNYSDYALPITGGTISNASSYAFKVKVNSSTKNVAIGFMRGDDDTAYLAYQGEGKWSVSSNIILHSGNYSSYALPITGGTISGSSSGILTINRTSGNPLIAFQANGTSVGFLGVDTDASPCYVDPINFGKYVLIHSGNIGSQNAGSAKRLVDANANSVVHISGNTFYIGDTIYPTTSTQILGKDIRLRYGESASYGFWLNSSGNVTIGGSDLASTNYKLYVDGSTVARGNLRASLGTNSELNIAVSNPLNEAQLGITSGGTAYLFCTGAYDLGFSTNSTRRMTITSGGNVGIGTASPQYKLDVNGTCRISGATTINNSLIVTGDVAVA